MAMNPTLKWGLIIGVPLFILLLILGAGTAIAQQQQAEADLGEEIEDEESDDPLTNSECRKLCRDICKHHPLLFGGRQKCQKKCKGDCKSGIDVTTQYYP